VEEDEVWRREDERPISTPRRSRHHRKAHRFEMTIADGFGETPLPAGMKAALAVKPGKSE
jgi:hypothetical protein